MEQVGTGQLPLLFVAVLGNACIHTDTKLKRESAPEVLSNVLFEEGYSWFV